jgi:hypothetical protein
MSQPSQVETDLSDAAAAIAKARDLLARSHPIDLAGLDGCVAKLCEDIAALPDGQRETVKPQLVGLIDNLNGLVESLSSQHNELSTTLKDIAARQRAVNAYGAAPGRSGEPKPKK